MRGRCQNRVSALRRTERRLASHACGQRQQNHRHSNCEVRSGSSSCKKKRREEEPGAEQMVGKVGEAPTGKSQHGSGVGHKVLATTVGCGKMNYSKKLGNQKERLQHRVDEAGKPPLDVHTPLESKKFAMERGSEGEPGERKRNSPCRKQRRHVTGGRGKQERAQKSKHEAPKRIWQMEGNKTASGGEP